MTAELTPAADSGDGAAVVWEDPADANVAWSQARLHYPRPITVLTQELRLLAADVGAARADEALERPGRRVARCINGYLYRAVRPLDLPAAELAARTRGAEARYRSVARTVGEHWRALLPEVEAILEAFHGVPLARLDRDALLAELSFAVTRSARLWEIHFLVVSPALVAMEVFTELYRELFEGTTELEALRLLQGGETKTVEAARALWALARDAGADARVRELFSRTPAEELPAAIEAAPHAAPLRAAFRGYLHQYGRRGITMDPAEPSIIERPAAVLGEIRELLRAGRDPEERMATVRAEREAAVSLARERLRLYPRPVIDEFETLLRAAQDAAEVVETHNFYIDFGLAYVMRLRVQALARVLVADGVLADPQEIFHLTLAEIRDAILRHAAPDLADRIAGRAAELARAAATEPPATLGAPPAGPGRSIIDRSAASFSGRPPGVAAEPDTIRGHPGSSGVARGTARVAHTPAEAGRIGAGEILVTEMTAAPWTPLFARIGALVTDAGGALSHSAIVAREYGIPAVVGTGTATSRIRDGDLVEVDGDAGLVRILSER